MASITALCLLVLVADPPKAPANKAVPTLEEVRKAFKQNIERLKNRRVKFVEVRLDGAPKKDFPPLDHPERVEEETVLTSDGRWKNHRKVFRSGMLWREEVENWNGVKGTHLKSERDKKQELQTTAEIGGERTGIHAHTLPQREMHLRPPLIDKLGIRSSLAPAPNDPGLLVLKPMVDDRAPAVELFTLDPAKNFWPVRIYSGPRPNEFNERSVQFEVVEFMRTPTGWYPKRMTQWWGFLRKTSYITTVSAEFPESFDDAALAVELPKGLRVKNSLARKDFIVGGEEFPWDRPVTAMDRVREIPTGDWLFYGGFGAAVALFVGVSWYAMSRGRGPRAKAPTGEVPSNSGDSS